MKYAMAMKKFAAGALVAGIALGGGLSVAHAVDTATAEGDQMVFTVALRSAPNGWAVRYQYSTEDSSAVKNEDYQATSGTITFPSGVKQQKIYVNTLDDNKYEGPEIFKLKLYDQEVNGLYRGVTGWTPSTIPFRQMPMPDTMTFTGQIMDNDSATDANKGLIYCIFNPWAC